MHISQILNQSGVYGDLYKALEFFATRDDQEEEIESLEETEAKERVDLNDKQAAEREEEKEEGAQ